MDDIIERKRSEADLPVKLTDGDRLALGSEITNWLAEIDDLELRLKAVKKELHGQIDTLASRVAFNASTLRAGFRHESVEIEIATDYERGTVEKTRLDTGEVFFTRTLTAGERQRGLFPERGAGDAAIGAHAP